MGAGPGREFRSPRQSQSRARNELPAQRGLRSGELALSGAGNVVPGSVRAGARSGRAGKNKVDVGGNKVGAGGHEVDVGGNNVACAAFTALRSTLFPPTGINVARGPRPAALSTKCPLSATPAPQRRRRASHTLAVRTPGATR
jgi:hypothetical protein